MQNKSAIEEISAKYEQLSPLMDERMCRQWAAAEAQAYGWGGQTAVIEATGLSVNTVRKGIAELKERKAHPEMAIGPSLRKAGGGRKRCTESDAQLKPALQRLVDPVTRGDPQSPLRWTCKSTEKLANELSRQGHAISSGTVGRLLKEDGYSLQGNRKTKEGASHPDRNAQFEHINAKVQQFQQRGQPVISVDAKKKELVGAFHNKGSEWQPKGKPEEVNMHDFPDPDLGKAIPFGVYDMNANEGWVSVGMDHDTAQFAAQAVRRWWETRGKQRYPDATELLITADSGGSNANRNRLWKVSLQTLANELRMPIHVCHLPPGTSKWNKIEHRMFCHITQNWRGRPLISHEVVIQLIANTTTQAGLKIFAELDAGRYPTGTKISNAEFGMLNLEKEDFHGEWNYVLLPQLEN